jgi:predicted anti-sigma-YlaC factor YlaD
MFDSKWCDFINKIKQDPLQKVSGLTVGDYYELQAHLLECEECWATVNEVAAQYKNEPEDPDSGWYKAQYN